jgi:hypothetical protein
MHAYCSSIKCLLGRQAGRAPQCHSVSICMYYCLWLARPEHCCYGHRWIKRLQRPVWFEVMTAALLGKQLSGSCLHSAVQLLESVLIDIRLQLAMVVMRSRLCLQLLKAAEGSIKAVYCLVSSAALHCCTCMHCATWLAPASWLASCAGVQACCTGPVCIYLCTQPSCFHCEQVVSHALLTHDATQQLQVPIVIQGRCCFAIVVWLHCSGLQ